MKDGPVLLADSQPKFLLGHEDSGGGLRDQMMELLGGPTDRCLLPLRGSHHIGVRLQAPPEGQAPPRMTAVRRRDAISSSSVRPRSLRMKDDKGITIPPMTR